MLVTFSNMVVAATYEPADPTMREMGGAPRNPAPRNHLWVRIVKPSGCPMHGCIWWKTISQLPPTSPSLQRSRQPPPCSSRMYGQSPY